MVNIITASDKVNSVLELQRKSILDVFNSAIAEINEEAQDLKGKEFVQNFQSDSLSFSKNIRKKCDFIDFNQNDSTMESKVTASFKELSGFLSLFDEFKNKDLKYDTFVNLASSYNIRHSDALILFAACCVDIESLRIFVQSHMHLIKFHA